MIDAFIEKIQVVNQEIRAIQEETRDRLSEKIQRIKDIEKKALEWAKDYMKNNAVPEEAQCCAFCKYAMIDEVKGLTCFLVKKETNLNYKCCEYEEPLIEGAIYADAKHSLRVKYLGIVYYSYQEEELALFKDIKSGNMGAVRLRDFHKLFPTRIVSDATPKEDAKVIPIQEVASAPPNPLEEEFQVPDKQSPGVNDIKKEAIAKAIRDKVTEKLEQGEDPTTALDGISTAIISDILRD